MAELILDNLLWVSNQAKLHRAVKELKENGRPVTEEAIRELYVRYGGLVLERDVAEELAQRKEAFVKRRKVKK